MTTTSDEEARPGEIVLLRDQFGILLQGPTQLVERALSDVLDRSGIDRSSSTRVPLAEGAAGVATFGSLASTTGEYVRLTAESMAKVEQFGPQFDANGAIRGFVRGGSGQFAGQLTFDQVRLDPQQLMSLQSAAVTLALRSAIADVQKALERVEGKVDRIAAHLQGRLKGDVIGSYRHLDAVVARTTARGRLLDADWDSVAVIGNQAFRDLETLRDTAMTMASDLAATTNVPKRADLLRDLHEEPGSLSDILRLILVAEQSLHLWQFLRLQHVARTDPDDLVSANDDARESLREHQQRDEQIVVKIALAVDQARVVAPLDAIHLLSKHKLDSLARLVRQDVADFAVATRLRELSELLEVDVPTLGDARADLQGRAIRTGWRTAAIGTASLSASSDALRQRSRRLGADVRSRIRRASDSAGTEADETPEDQ